MNDIPPCPWCRTPRHVQTSGSTMKALYCRRCGREFEAEDDSDIGYGPPDRRLLREERRLQRKAGRSWRGD